MFKVCTALAGAVPGASWLGYAQAQCTDDGNGNRTVAVNELLSGVNMGAGTCNPDPGNP